MMRDGRLLIEGNPNALINKHNCATLENVFVQVCKTDPNGNLKDINRKECIIKINSDKQMDHEMQPMLDLNSGISKEKKDKIEKNKEPNGRKPPNNLGRSCGRILALCMKSWTKLRRNPGFL